MRLRVVVGIACAVVLVTGIVAVVIKPQPIRPGDRAGRNLQSDMRAASQAEPSVARAERAARLPLSESSRTGGALNADLPRRGDTRLVSLNQRGRGVATSARTQHNVPVTGRPKSTPPGITERSPTTPQISPKGR